MHEKKILDLNLKLNKSNKSKVLAETAKNSTILTILSYCRLQINIENNLESNVSSIKEQILDFCKTNFILNQPTVKMYSWTLENPPFSFKI